MAKRSRILASLASIALASTLAPVARADHLDTVTARGCVSRLDIGGLYVFRSPANPNNTVFVLTVSPFAGSSTPDTFQHGAKFDIRMTTNYSGQIKDDLILRTTFGRPDANGIQHVTLRSGGHTIAAGSTRTNLSASLNGLVGLFRAGPADDPEFFDSAQFNGFLDGGSFPRAPAANRFGPNVNILAIALEVPSIAISASGVLAVWARTLSAKGKQVDRIGRPFINNALIPPVPRGPDHPGGVNLRGKFNAGSPSTDVSRFTAPMEGVLQNFWGRTPGDAAVLADFFLPDVLVFEIGNPNGYGVLVQGSLFGNGRRMRDDYVDVMLNVISNGNITTDNVADDNGTRITDGNAGSGIAFPYVGPPNVSATPGPACGA